MDKEQKKDYFKQKMVEWREKNPERDKELKKKYKNSDKGKKANRKYLRKRYAKNPTHSNQSKEYIKEYMRDYFKKDKSKHNKFLIRQKTYNLFKKGIIKKELCDLCNSKDNLEIHHLNYNSKYNILVLCRRCHRKLHRIDELNLLKEVKNNGKR